VFDALGPVLGEGGADVGEHGGFSMAEVCGRRQSVPQ